ncbi:Elongation factor 1-alpha [Acorus calamus]|uniref:Elongation factor 1-alpha n=1 Tax=Acorus calamus TaxID=4465 RepID=A0AAV9DJW7_ACOCL|nr:Elongation factor 1-alpha [Acorus calamus]
MSRKANHRIDYDEDYYDYDVYDDYDAEEEQEGYGKSTVVNQSRTKPGIWRCSICTLDNDDSFTSCEICGTVRASSIDSHSNGQGGRAPFEFDSPSPDDLVSAGKTSSKINSKGWPRGFRKINIVRKIATTFGADIFQRNAQGKGSFAYAWVMDESSEERERGITMTVAVAHFNSKRYRVVVLDSPGHKDFVPNMISGTTQADAAILVVDASVGAFEAGMDGNGVGQTREHAQLIRSFGVDQIIIAVNKMDVVDYSRERFDLIKVQLSSFLHSCGFKESLVSWVPISCMKNQNLVTAPSDVLLSSWYHGPSLLEAIDSLQPPVRDITKPLRMPICDVVQSGASGQVLVMPIGELATVRSIECDSHKCSIARAGDNASVSLQGIDLGHLMSGMVLCHQDFPVAVATHLELKVLILDITMPILIGTQVEFLIHHAKEAATVVKIHSLLDQKTGQISKKAPRFLKAKQSAVIEVVLDGVVCVEEFSECRALGRVFLRALGNTVAVGIVNRVIEN